MNEEFYDNLWLIFANIRAITKTFGGEVLVSDKPCELILGWTHIHNENTKQYNITLSKIKNRSAFKNPYNFHKTNFEEASDALYSLIINQNGRIEIAKFLSYEKSIPELEKFLDKIVDLKAFW